MHHLTHEDWSSFKTASGWDGDKFECLVRLLLTEYSDRRWSGTKKSWDGSKDFTLHSDCFTAWAECKMFDSPLPLKGVASTLLMADVNAVDLVIFFSFSPLTRTAIQAAARFAWRHNLHLQVYEDEGLETLILHCEKAMKDYFPGLQAVNMAAPAPKAFTQIWTDVDETYSLAQLETATTPDHPGPRYLGRGQLFRLDLTLHNAFPLQADGLSLDLASAGRDFHLVAAVDADRTLTSLPSALDVSLGPGEVRAYSLFYRLKKVSRRRKHLPRPTLVHRDGTRFQTPENVFRLADALYTPLVGKGPRSFIEDCRQWTNSRREPLFIAIHGASGAGKSRLLQELREPLLGNGYRTTALNAADDGRSGDLPPLRAFLPVLTQKLLRLPPLPSRKDLQVFEQFPRPLAAENPEAALDVEALTALLAPPEDMDETALEEHALPLLVHALRTQGQSMAILVDNVQDYDDTVARFLRRLVEQVRSNGPRCAFILAFNTQSWRRHGETERLLRDWVRAEVDLPRRYKTIELIDFDQDAFAEFLAAVLTEGASAQTFIETHEGLWKALWNHVEPRPLHIEQALLHARDRQVVVLDGETGFLRITDVGAFVDLISRHFISRDLAERMKQRWICIENDWRRSCPDRVLAFQVFCFCGRLRIEDAEALGVGEEHVEDFVSRGLARRVGMVIEPYHRQTQRIFHDDVFQFPTLSGGAAHAVAAHLLRAGGVIASPRLALAGFTAAAIASKADLELVSRALGRGWLTAVEPQELTFLRAARRVAMSANDEVVGDRAGRVRLLLQASESLRHALPREEGHALFEEADGFVLELLTPGERDNDIAQFHAHYGNQMLVGHDDEAFLTVLEEAEGLLEPSAAEPWFRSFLADRLCVAQKSLGAFADARRYGSRALRIAQSMPKDDNGRREREVFAYIDIANIYQNGCGIGTVEDICAPARNRVHLARLYWRKAYDIFRLMPRASWPKADFMPMVMLYRAQEYLLAGDSTGCRQAMRDALRDCRDKGVPFFGVKLHLIAALSYLLDGPAALDAAVGEASQALTWATEVQVDRYLWTCEWLKGVLLIRKGLVKEAQAEYERAAVNLHKAAGDRVKIYHYHFYDDLILQGRRFGWFGPEALHDLTVPSLLRARYRPVLEADDLSFADILARYRPTARFTDGRFNLPSP